MTASPNFYCCLLFGNIEEVDGLLLKLESEKDYISAWFIVENAFDLKGRPKDCVFQDILENDKRFEKFKDRIHYTSLSTNFVELYKYKQSELVDRQLRRLLGRWNSILQKRFEQKPNFFAEFNQRDACIDDVLALAQDDDYLFVTDFDEIINLEGARHAHVTRFIAENMPNFIGVGRLRFVFDFNNLQLGKWRTVPLIRVGALRKGLMRIFDSRLKDNYIPLDFTPIIYEYSYCIPKEKIIKKTKSFAHHSTSETAIERSFLANHLFVSDGSVPPRSIFWCETFDMSMHDHPTYIKDVFQNIKTDNVAVNYRENRRRLYPEVFKAK